ncbi:antibiotic biosynthesis monooxygenase [Modestobacter sp. VKM Ac-2676]|nr:antibiotic biosynthesis monooxygenase [Modestobacter sp. VKM Ac-2676]
MSFVIVATVVPKPESRDAVREALLAAVPQVHTERGCELYSVQEDEQGFVFVERWADQEAMAGHAQGEALKTLMATVSDHLAQPLDVRVLQPLPAGDPDKGAV